MTLLTFTNAMCFGWISKIIKLTVERASKLIHCDDTDDSLYNVTDIRITHMTIG